MGGVGGAHFGGDCRRLNVAGWQAMSLIVPPYPPARYIEDQPEVSAWLRRAPENGGRPPDYDSFGSREVPLPGQPASHRRRLRPVPRRYRPQGRRPGPALPPRDVRGVLCVVGNRQALRRHRLDRRTSERLPLRPTRRHPRLPQRGRRADVDLDAVCSRRSSRALLRGLRPAGRHDRRGASRVVHRATTTSSSTDTP